MSPREGKGISLLIMLSDTYETHLIDSVCGPPEGTALLLLYYTKAYFILDYHGKNFSMLWQMLWKPRAVLEL